MDFILWNQKVVRAQYLVKYLILRKWSEKNQPFQSSKIFDKNKDIAWGFILWSSNKRYWSTKQTNISLKWHAQVPEFFHGFQIHESFYVFSKSMRMFLFSKIKFNLHANKLQIFCENKCDIYLLCSLRYDMTVKKFHWPINILTYFISRV